MKRLTSFLTMIISIGIIYSCDESIVVVDPPGVFRPEPPNFIGEAVLSGHSSEPGFGVGPSIDLSYTGEGSSNTITHFRVSFSSIGAYSDTNNFRITGGQFIIASGDDTLYGSISGWGVCRRINLQAYEKWVIDGGTGLYKNVSGNFDVELNARPSDNSIHMSISGTLNHATDRL